MTQGYLTLVLHNHLPYIRHPEYEFFLEERWFYEAMIETYLPIMRVLEKLHHDGVDFNLTLSFSPTLLSMFNDELLQERFLRHMENLIDLGEKEVKRTWETNEYSLAKMYLARSRELFYYFRDSCQKNIIHKLKKLNYTGKIELITCAATHGFLPFMGPEAIRAQIGIAINTFKSFFDFRPAGIWLPECAYVPGIEIFLKEYDLKYFFLETHGLLFANPPNETSPYTPIQCPNGLIAFGRDPECTKQVWSKDEGYPGDPNYREYYRDLGYDLPLDYIAPYIHPDGIRLNTGFKYYRITNNDKHKELYNPQQAQETAANHAGNFIFNRQKQIEHLSTKMDRKPIIVAPFDGELFGHWWYEGPLWLDFVLRKIHYDQNQVKTITPSRYLDIYPQNHQAQPAISSWGDKGFFEVWLNGSNNWIYRHLHQAADYMVELSNNYSNPCEIEKRALQQAARELLLAQASDWAFIMKTDTMVEYAKKRTIDHLGRFFKIYKGLKNNNLDIDWLKKVERKNNIFPEIDYRIYCSK